MQNNDFDDILIQLGMGKWNLIYILFAAYACLLMPPQFLGGVYLVPRVNYTCLVPENENITFIAQDSCTYYRNQSGTTEEKVQCTNWDFNDSIFFSTMTSEFELVCERDYHRATFQGVYMFGTLLSQFIGGYCADRFGRKIVVLVAQVVTTITSIGIAFLNNFTAILIVRFILGTVYLLTPYILAMEVCEPDYRSIVGILAGLPWAIGTILWGGVAYFIRDWRYLQLAVSIPSVLIFGLLYFMDESPRWLIVQGRHDDAMKVLKKAAQWNKAQLPSDDNMFKLMKDIEEQTMTSKTKQKTKEEVGTTLGKGLIALMKPRLFSTKRMSVITAALCFNFFAVSLVFDGLNLSGDIYSADPFLYIILGGLVEVPGYSITAPLIARLGRKYPTLLNYLICGVVILVVAFIPSDISWLVMTLVLIGKLCISAAYQIIYVYSTELFPTEVRSQGIGLACVCQQVASTLSPYITIYIGLLVPWVPSVVFGGASLVAGIVTLSLRETLNVPLPDTITDLQRTTKRSRHHETDGTKAEMGILKIVNSQD